MNRKPLTEEQLAKLPRWAQEHIHNLERRMDVAERTLMEFKDNQTPSGIFYKEYCCIGEGTPATLTRFVQAESITVQAHGVRVHASINDSRKVVELQWGDTNAISTDVAFIPESFQKARLVNKIHMR